MPKSAFLLGGHLPAAALDDVGDEQHVGAGLVELEPVATSSARTEGAKGLKLSRYLTLRFKSFCIVGERGSPRIERPPRARGPNSMRPCIQPTALPGERIGRAGDHLVVVEHLEDGTGCRQGLGGGVGREGRARDRHPACGRDGR
jgi:hypothetical protein